MGLKYDIIDQEVINTLESYRKTALIVRKAEKKEQKQREDETDTTKDIIFQTISHDNIGISDDPVEFDDKGHTFITFEKCKFGKKAVLDIKHMYHVERYFWNVTFIDCVFQNVYFKASHFWGCKFINCTFSELGVYFDNCSFRHIKTQYNNGNFVTYNISTEFKSCNINLTHWINCLGDYLIFQNNTFILSSFSNCEMPESIFDNNGFYSTTFNNCNLLNVSITNIKHADVEFHFTDSQKDTNMHKMIYVSKMKKDIIQKDDYVNLAKMYYSLINYLQLKNLDVDYMPEYRYLTNYYNMLSKNNWYDKIWDRISWAICGFGECIGRFFIWIVSLIIVPAFLYMKSGITVDGALIKYRFSLENPVSFEMWINDFANCLKFSIGNLTTVIYGNLAPMGIFSDIISIIQVFLGLIFMAIFISIVLKQVLK